MSTDKQQQEEELLILKSILNDEVIELGDENDQFEINIDFQLPARFYLRLIDDSNKLSTLIKYLPPLVLTVQFHEQYPSSIDPPTFVLSSCYLSRQYLQNMCQMLDKVWEQNLSQPIVFQWIECLKEQFLSINELCLSNIDLNNDDDNDPRAMSSYDPTQAAYVYEQLIEYNREKESEKFLNEYHECPICTSNNIPGRDMIRLHKCHHFFCRDCLHDYAQMHINTGSVEWLLCPDSQCQLTLLPSEIKIIVNNNELYDRYERLLLQKTLEQMQDIVWCPRLIKINILNKNILLFFRCQQAVLTGDEKDNLALCDQCRFTFCKKCKKPYHSQTLCGYELELAELKGKYKKMRLQMQALNLSPDDEENVLREVLAVARIESSTRLCPNIKCKVPIEKNAGCDHMYCTRCQTHFNWSDVTDQTSDAKILVEKYENDIDKLHNALEKERNLNDNDDILKAPVAPLISKLLQQRAKKCPNKNCERVNIKSGSGNYLICPHCKRGFCFSCGQSVNNPKTHFGHACKQHSV
jgi:E3 ubiquitin-protein ligase RNF14